MEFRGLFSILRIRDSGDAGGELAGVVAGERAARDGASLHVLVMDMDEIQSLKDKFGRLQRMGGDEFVAMLGGFGWGDGSDAAAWRATSGCTRGSGGKRTGWRRGNRDWRRVWRT